MMRVPRAIVCALALWGCMAHGVAQGSSGRQDGGRSGVFANPLLESGPDPWVVFDQACPGSGVHTTLFSA